MAGVFVPDADSRVEKTFRTLCALEDHLIATSSFGELRDDASLSLARNLVGLWDRYMGAEEILVSREFYAAPHVYALGRWIEDDQFAHLWQYLNNKLSKQLSPEQARMAASYRERYRIKERD